MTTDIIAFVSEYLLPHLDQLFRAAMVTVVTTVVTIKAKAHFEKKAGKPKKQKGKGKRDSVSENGSGTIAASNSN